MGISSPSLHSNGFYSLYALHLCVSLLYIFSFPVHAAVGVVRHFSDA